MLAEYIAYIPYFLAAVSLGILVNYFFFINGELTTKRVGREILGAFWVSLLVFSIIDQWFDLKLLITLVFCSVGGLFSSRIITFLRKDLLEYIFIQIIDLTKQFFKWLGSKFKSNKEDEDEQE